MPAPAQVDQLPTLDSITLPEAQPVRALVFNDHPVFRSGLSWKLNGADGIEALGDSGSLHDVIESARIERPDAVIADLRIGDGDSEGVEAVETLVSSLPGIAVIAYSDFYGSSYRSRMESAGATFVMKSSGLSKLVSATLRAITDINSRELELPEAA